VAVDMTLAADADQPKAGLALPLPRSWVSGMSSLST